MIHEQLIYNTSLIMNYVGIDLPITKAKHNKRNSTIGNSKANIPSSNVVEYVNFCFALYTLSPIR